MTTYDEYIANGGSDEDWREFLEDLDEAANDETDWDS